MNYKLGMGIQFFFKLLISFFLSRIASQRAGSELNDSPFVRG